MPNFRRGFADFLPAALLVLAGIGGLGIARLLPVETAVATINASVDQQNAATREIAQSAQSVSRGTAETSTVIDSVRNSAEETGHSAEEVSDAARGLLQVSQRLNDDVDRFLKTLLAA